MTDAVTRPEMPHKQAWSCSPVFSGILPPAVKTANILGRALHRLGVRSSPLDADTLLKKAQHRTGLDDIGPYFNYSHLVRLVEALNNEACLNSAGRFMAYYDVLHLLENRLYLAAERGCNPAIAAQDISRPVFITGLPRTGTTLLHRLLTRDPATRAPRTWETMHPLFPANGYGDETARIRLAQNQLCWFRHITRNLDHAHLLNAQEPEECIAITAHALSGARFHISYWAPEYEYWLRQQDQRPLYAYHRYFLQHLQAHSTTRRWVLKAPAHIENLPALIQTYPDALIVQTHRNPLTALASVISLTNIIQSAFRDPIPPVEIAKHTIDRWSWAIRQSLHAREQLQARGVRFIDVFYDDLIQNPLSTARKIYQAAGIVPDPDTTRRMKAFLDNNPKDKHGRHLYTTAVAGMEPEQISAAFKEYYDYFDINYFNSTRAA